MFDPQICPTSSQTLYALYVKVWLITQQRPLMAFWALCSSFLTIWLVRTHACSSMQVSRPTEAYNGLLVAQQALLRRLVAVADISSDIRVALQALPLPARIPLSPADGDVFAAVAALAPLLPACTATEPVPPDAARGQPYSSFSHVFRKLNGCSSAFGFADTGSCSATSSQVASARL